MPVETSPAGRTPSDCPQGWREVPLGSVTDVRFSSVDKLTYGSEEPIRLCNYIEVYQNDYITADLEFMRASATHAEIDRLGLQVGDVIITKDSEAQDDIGVPAVVDYAAPDLVCGYHLGLLRPKQTQVDPTFLSKQLGHHRLAHYFGRQANGLTRYGLPISAVTNAPIWLPHLTEQKTIGLLLRLVDEAIATTEAVIAKLKQVHSGLLHDLLTRGLDADGQLRDPIGHPEQFQDSPLGRIPREWEVSRLVDACEKIADRDHTTPTYVSEGVRMVSPTHFIGEDEIDFKSCPLISVEAHLQNRQKTDLRVDDVIIHRIGAGLGRVRLMKQGMPEFSILHSLAMIRSKPQRLASRFLYWVLQVDVVQVQMGLGTQSIGVPDLGLDKIGGVLMPLPVPAEQVRIADALDGTAEGISSEIRSLAKLHQLKSGLMTDLLTGRVRVPETLDLAEKHISRSPPSSTTLIAGI